MRLRSPLIRAAISLLLLMSPVGAPLVGLLIAACPADGAVTASGPFALGFSSCGLNRSIEQLYQSAVMLSFLPIVFAGPILGGSVTIAWWLAALASGAGSLWYLCRAVADAAFVGREE